MSDVEKGKVVRVDKSEAQFLVDAYKDATKFDDFVKLVGRYTRFSKYEVGENELQNYFMLMYTMEQDILNSKEVPATKVPLEAPKKVEEKEPE